MKRTFLALCLVLALVLGGVGAAAHTLWDQAGAVAFSAQTRQGDPAAAQGLAATQQALCRPGYHTLGRATANLQWDLTFDLGDPAASRAAFSTPGEAAPEANLDAGVRVSFPHQGEMLFAGYGISAEALAQGAGDESIDPRLVPLCLDVASRTPAGGSHTETVDPSQYLEAYPLQVDLDLADVTPLPQSYADLGAADPAAQARNQAAQTAFQAFFSFPFAPDTRWEVTVTKGDSGWPNPDWISQITIRPTGPDPVMEVLSAPGKDAVYFAFTPTLREGGRLADFSQVPGGYGIYRLALSGNQGGDFQAQLDSLELVYPLDPQGGGVTGLTLSPDGSTLFLVTCQGGESTCAVLDTAEGTCRQTFPLPAAACYPLDRASGLEDGALPPDRQQTTSYLLPGEGCLLALGAEGLACYLPDEAGRYQLRWQAPTDQGFTGPNGAALRAAWNGEKLALARYDPDAPTTGLVLRVYDGAGALLYEGVYDTSLNHAQSWYDASGAFQNVAAAARYPGGAQALALSWAA